MKRLVVGRSGQLACALKRADPALETLGREDGVDLTRPGTVAAALHDRRPALVINAAAHTAVDRAEEEPEAAAAVNRDGVAALAEAAADVGAALVHVSTDYVFNGTRDGEWTEDDPVAPLSVYGRTKRDGEVAALAAQPRTLVLRTSWVYSPWGRNFVTTMIGLAGRERLTVVDDQHGKPTSAMDLAEAILAVAPRLEAAGADAPVWGVRHYAGAGAVSWAGFAREIFAQAEAVGLIARAPDVAAISSAEWPTAAKRPLNSALDCRRFERDFGIEMRPWRESLARVIAALAAEAAC